VIVNGVEWETESVEIEIEGDSGFSQNDLKIGMLVQVKGNLNDDNTTGTATTILFNDNVEGPITGISESSTGAVKTIQVMGQTVIVENGITFFDDTPPYSFAAMAVGDVVEISGLVNFDDTIQATFIELKADNLAAFLSGGNLLEITGVVSGLTADTFQINNLTIDFFGVTPRNGSLVNGALVEVKGNDLTGDTLTATDIEVKTAGLDIDDIDKAHVEGFITDFDPFAMTFRINGQLVDYSTAILIGGTEDELLDGIKVEAEGPIVGGELRAVKVEFRESIKFEANVATVQSESAILTLEGLPGIQVIVDDTLTEFEPEGSTLNDIVIGNEVEIRARMGAGDTIIATELEILDEPSDRSIIQGTVDSFEISGDVVIIGVTVDTTTINDDDFKDGDVIIGLVEFFNRIEVGDLVKARFRDGIWDQIEFED